MDNNAQVVDGLCQNQQTTGASQRKETSNHLLADVAAASQRSNAVSSHCWSPDIDLDNQAAHSILPPYLLDELIKHDPSFKQTYDTTLDLINQGSGVIQPRLREQTNGEREVYDAKDKDRLPGTLIRSEGQNPTGNDTVDKVYDFTGVVRDFYQKEFGRNSIDGHGMKIISSVNYRDNPDRAFENAVWTGEQMAYGHPDSKSPFKTFALLDVTGHEMTHGVTQSESNEKYYGQSGALNESLSDVFGELIKQYSLHQTADKADWLVGVGMFKDNIHARALRDMLHPGTAYDDPVLGKDPQIGNMNDYKRIKRDSGGVHFNSGIPNKAFALFATSVGGNAWEDPGHIWFAARKAAGENPSFASFAYQTIEAAKKIGHADEVEKLEKSWDAVGVKPDKDAKDTKTPPKENKDQPNDPGKKSGKK